MKIGSVKVKLIKYLVCRVFALLYTLEFWPTLWTKVDQTAGTRCESKAADEPWTATRSQPQFPQPNDFYWGNTDSLQSLSVFVSHIHSVCVREREKLGGWVGAGLLMCDLKSRRWKERLCFWLELKAFNLSNKLNHKTAEPRHVLNWFIDIFFNFVAMHQAVLI